MRRLVMICRHFPPSHAVGGKRPHRLARYLPASGWCPTVYTSPPPPASRPDPTAGLPLPAEVEVHRDWPLASISPAASDGTEASPSGPRSAPRGLGRRLAFQLEPPLGRGLWRGPRTAQAVAALARACGASALWASSGPAECLWVGALASRWTGLPLLLDLRDPWSLNFLQQDKAPLTRWFDAALEARLFAAAAAITFTSEATTAAYRRRYPTLAARMVTIESGFEPAARPPVAPTRRHGPLDLVHFGSCYGERRLDGLLRALARLTSEERAAISVEVMGRVAAADLRLAAALGVADRLRVAPAIPYAEGLARLAAADRLLLLGYGDETLYLPAKLYDYLLVGVPILALAPPSELAARVVAAGGEVAAPGDIEAIVDLLRVALAKKRAGDRPIREPSPRDSAEVGAAALAALLDRVVG
ncbi:MAG: glycosyltransferase [Polyangiaceae bacterium]